MPKPATSSADSKVLQDILKGTVSTIDDEKYKHGDHADIVAAYEPFFISVSAITDRLNVIPLVTATKIVLQSKPEVANIFANSICSAFVHCRTKLKGYNGIGGKKLDEKWGTAVKRVVDVMYRRGEKSKAPTPVKNLSPNTKQPLQAPQTPDRKPRFISPPTSPDIAEVPTTSIICSHIFKFKYI